MAGVLLPIKLALAICTLIGIAIPPLFNFTFMSRKERTDDKQKLFENSRGMLQEQTDRRNDFMAAMAKAVKKPKPSADDVLAIMRTGEAYFATLKVMAQAILDDRVSASTRDNDLVPKISEAMLKNLPPYYEALTNLCGKVGLPFSGVFEEKNYESLFRVVDLYDHATWAAVRERMSSQS